jgi:hypothetical protein
MARALLSAREEPSRRKRSLTERSVGVRPTRFLRISEIMGALPGDVADESSI